MAKLYRKLAFTSISEYNFIIRNRFYKTTSGATMGNPFSPLPSRVKNLENKLAKSNTFPDSGTDMWKMYWQPSEGKKQERFLRNLTEHIETSNSPWKAKNKGRYPS